MFNTSYFSTMSDTTYLLNNFYKHRQTNINAAVDPKQKEPNVD